MATALVCYPAWPGYMSYDSLLAYRQARYGVETMLWPPFHTYMFAVSRAAGAETWGVFVFQTFTLFFAAAVALSMLAPGRRAALALAGVFALCFAYFPPLLGTAMTQWRDAPTASFALLGLALWLEAGRRRAMLPLLLGVLSMGAAVALRYNALTLVAGMLLLMVISPFLGGKPSGRARAAVALAIAAVLGLAWASTQWRLPDLLRLPAPDSLGGTLEFDVVGISACADRNYLPPEVTGGRPISPHQIRKAYDPRHLQMTLAPKPGVPPMIETDGGGTVAAAWRRAVLAEPGCYLAHRTLVFTEQMGLAKGGVFYPVHSFIDANPFGLALAHPAASHAVSAYVMRNATDPWRRPALLYGLAALMVLAASLRRPGHAPFLLAVLAGCAAYPALLFIAAPAADARYIFPSSVLCAFLVVACAGLLLRRPSERATGS